MYNSHHGEGVVLMKPYDDESFDDDYGNFIMVAKQDTIDADDQQNI